MGFKNLISWSRDRSVPVVRQREEDHPMFALHQDMNVLLTIFTRFYLLSRFGSSFASAFCWLNIELSESDKEIKVVMELPVLQQKDEDVSLDNDVLTIRG